VCSLREAIAVSLQVREGGKEQKVCAEISQVACEGTCKDFRQLEGGGLAVRQRCEACKAMDRWYWGVEAVSLAVRQPCANRVTV